MSQNLIGKLNALYVNEQNFELSCFYDGGFSWKLGDTRNGFSRQGNEETLEEAIEKLCEAAHEELQSYLVSRGFRKEKVPYVRD